MRCTRCTEGATGGRGSGRPAALQLLWHAAVAFECRSLQCWYDSSPSLIACRTDLQQQSAWRMTTRRDSREKKRKQFGRLSRRTGTGSGINGCKAVFFFFSLLSDSRAREDQRVRVRTRVQQRILSFAGRRGAVARLDRCSCIRAGCSFSLLFSISRRDVQCDAANLTPMPLKLCDILQCSSFFFPLAVVPSTRPPRSCHRCRRCFGSGCFHSVGLAGRRILSLHAAPLG